jgi:hypothetical protein
VAYESSKLTVTEQTYLPNVFELLAVVHALRVFRHYLLCSGAPRPPGVLSDFTLPTDNQAASWLCTKRDINRFLARWLDEIEDFRFDVEHVAACPRSPQPSQSLHWTLVSRRRTYPSKARNSPDDDAGDCCSGGCPPRAGCDGGSGTGLATAAGPRCSGGRTLRPGGPADQVLRTC